MLQANGCEVWIPRRQGCCGALHYHAAEEPAAREFAAANCEAFGATDAEKFTVVDAIITNAAGCGCQLKDYAHMMHDTPQAEAAARFQRKVRDVSEFLMELGPVKPTHPLAIKATYHDACHLRHAQQIFKQPRALLEMIPGLELIPLPESELCCGAAGSYNLTQPEMADATRRPQGREHHRHRREGDVHRQRRLPDADHPPPQGHWATRCGPPTPSMRCGRATPARCRRNWSRSDHRKVQNHPPSWSVNSSWILQYHLAKPFDRVRLCESTIDSS